MNLIGKRSSASLRDFFMVTLKFNGIACGQCLGLDVDHMRYQIGIQKAGLAVPGLCTNWLLYRPVNLTK
jgi:hypothetical protein